MTPEEKAKELIDKFYDKIEDFDLEHECPCIELRTTYAKQCALIAVDEIINLEVWHWPHNTPEGLLFWQQVKTEIQNK